MHILCTTAAKPPISYIRNRSVEDRGYAYFRELRYGEVRRISLPRTRVNKGKKDKKGRGMITQILASSKWHQVGLRKLEEPRASPVLLCLSSNG
jgi:hypothetical protein